METDDDAVKEAAAPLLEDTGKIAFMKRVKERRGGGEAEYRRDLEARVVRRERGAKESRVDFAVDGLDDPADREIG